MGFFLTQRQNVERNNTEGKRLSTDIPEVTGRFSLALKITKINK